MKPNFGTLILLLAVILMAAITGCERTNRQTIPVGPAPSDGMMPMGDDEESTVQLALTDTYDHIRAGAHLILAYNAATNSFEGTVKNTTGAILPQVRVEVHLSNGVELGPTTPKDLAPGEQIPVTLMAEGPPFDKWTAHPEVGGDVGEGEGEHSGEGAGEGGGEHGQGTGGEGPEDGGN